MNGSILGKCDRWILVVAFVLIAFGLVFVYSSSFAVAAERFGGSTFFLERQAGRAIIALVLFLFLIHLDYHTLAKLSTPIYLVSIVFLVWVLLLPDSAAINGAKRWLTLGPVRFQVSEFARMGLVLMLANQLSKLSSDELRRDSTFYFLLGEIALVILLIAIEPDFSTSVLVASVAFSMLFVGGARWKHLLTTGAVALGIGFVYMVSAPYRMKRIIGFFNQSETAQTFGFQARQALLAIGNGQIFGTGLGAGEQKYHYLPEPYTDFIFAIVGEEGGFVGLMVLISLYGILVWRGINVARNAPDRLGQLLAYGCTVLIAVYFVVHTAVNAGLIPTTGIPLPFVSYGGVSLIFTTASIAILLNISAQNVTWGVQR